jgi:hypothetical protein
VPQGAIWSSVYVNVQEEKVAIPLKLHGEMDAGMDVTEVVMELLQLFGSMKTNYKCIIHVKEAKHGLIGCLGKCHLLEVFSEEVGNDR